MDREQRVEAHGIYHIDELRLPDGSQDSGDSTWPEYRVRGPAIEAGTVMEIIAWCSRDDPQSSTGHTSSELEKHSIRTAYSVYSAQDQN